MKTRLGFVIAVVALCATCCLADLPSRPTLEWKARSGRDEPRSDRGAAISKTDQSAIEMDGLNVVLSPTHFRGKETYEAVLGDLKTAQNIVHIQARIVARNDPDAGTIIDIGGAVFGYQLHPAENAPRGMAEVVACVGRDGEEPTWVRTGMLVAVGEDGRSLIAFPLSVRFNPDGSWALLYKDITLKDRLPLVRTAPKRVISVRPGNEDGDEAIVENVQVSSTPLRRINSPVVSSDGKVQNLDTTNSWSAEGAAP